MVTESTLDILRSILIFKDVPNDDLEWLISKAEIRDFNTGDYAFKPGDKIEQLTVVLSGRFSIRLPQGDQLREYAVLERGTITGALPYSRMSEARGVGVALEPSRLLMLHKNHFHDLAIKSYALTQALVGVMIDRTREFTAFTQQNEKLISLGKLSAGLAHELNNPAAAIVRSASRLKQHLSKTPESFKRIIQVRMTPEQVDALNALLFSKLDKSKQPPLSMLQRAALEDDLRDWFDEHDFVCGDSAADDERVEIFADFQITVDDLESIAKEFSGVELFTALEWCEGVLNTEQYVSDIHEAASRIKTLIESVKGYSNMDRANDAEPIDVRDGIRSTLTMLGHKLKQKRIHVREQFQEDAPRIMGYIGELNQVWTNLIDNAIDAMDENGALEIHSKVEAGSLKVSVIDNGSGIPDNIVSRIFDPFFTTKPVGHGTGLGLDIVKKIIDRHKSDIKVRSRPGRTEFEIRFPIPEPLA